MFRCDNCGSGYSVQAASSWQSCPWCLAKERINIPLSFEFGWSADETAEVEDPARLERPLEGSAPEKAPLLQN